MIDDFIFLRMGQFDKCILYKILEDAEQPLPKDEDAEEFTMMRGSPVPSLEQVRAPGVALGPRERLMIAPKTQPNSPETQRQP